MDAHLLAKIIPYLIPLLIVGIVAFRLFRNAPRKVKLKRLFIVPLVALLGTWTAFRQAGAPGGIWIAADIAAALAGAAAGFLSVHHQEFRLDPESREITSRAAPIGTILFGALFAIRFGLKLAFPEWGGSQDYGSSAAAFHPAAGAMGWTDAGLVFSAAMLMATSATTWVRTRHLSAQLDARSADVERSRAGP